MNEKGILAVSEGSTARPLCHKTAVMPQAPPLEPDKPGDVPVGYCHTIEVSLDTAMIATTINRATKTVCATLGDR